MATTMGITGTTMDMDMGMGTKREERTGGAPGGKAYIGYYGGVGGGQPHGQPRRAAGEEPWEA